MVSGVGPGGARNEEREMIRPLRATKWKKEDKENSQIEVLVEYFSFVFENSVSKILVFLQFDLEHFGLESSGRSVRKKST